MASNPAPFIPPEPSAAGPSPWGVFAIRPFLRLWLAQVTSSLGDWIGIIAILSMAARLSGGSAFALGLVMTARMLPGFFLAPLGGALVDRWDRRKVMVSCDLARAGVFALLPFANSLAWLVVASFVIEILTLLWGPAKDASVPKLVPPKQLASANSLGLIAAYATFPIGGLLFASLAGLAAFLGQFGGIQFLQVDQESLALWADGVTFVISALLIARLPLGRADGDTRPRVDWTQTWRDLVDGVRFMAREPLVRGVILGLGAGLIGGGAMIPLGPLFASQILGGGPATFSLLMVALGSGAAIGVVSLLAIQRWLPRRTVFVYAVIGSGVGILLAASFSGLAPAAFAIVFVGACAGTAYVTGFTVLQESVRNELLGRTFATLYTVVRLCLLIALTVSPLFADLYEWLMRLVFPDAAITIGRFSYSLPGVRMTLWIGGLIAIGAGLYARHEVHRAARAEHPSSGSTDQGGMAA
ncbi:MAG: MFS transporter [Acidimicrobiia bacterium]